MCKDATSLFVFYVPGVVTANPVAIARKCAPTRFPSSVPKARGRYLAMVCTEQDAFDIMAEFNALCTDSCRPLPRGARVRPNCTADSLSNDRSGEPFSPDEITDLFNVFCSAVARHLMAECLQCIGAVDGQVMSALLRTASSRWQDAVMKRCAELLSVVTVTRNTEVYAGVATFDRIIWRNPENDSSHWSAT